MINSQCGGRLARKASSLVFNSGFGSFLVVQRGGTASIVASWYLSAGARDPVERPQQLLAAFLDAVKQISRTQARVSMIWRRPEAGKLRIVAADENFEVPGSLSGLIATALETEA